MSSDLYEVLGVDKSATAEEVRKAYRKRALETHPDRLPQNISLADKEAAEEQFRLVNNAYEVLNNTENRKLYDQLGVWPPPEQQRDFEPTNAADPFSFVNDPFARDPFFSAFPGRAGSRAFAFSDPFELFNSLFGDVHSAFDSDPMFARSPFTRSPFDDPFFRSPFPSPFGRMGSDPFGGSLFGRMGADPFAMSPFGSAFGGHMLGYNTNFGDLPTGGRAYSSTRQAVGSGSQFVSQSQMRRTINGRTEVITKRTDTEGNEHVTYSSPDGERYTINGIEQPRGTIEGPSHRRSDSPQRRQPPPPVADRPAEPPASTYAPPPPPAQSFKVPITSPSDRHARAKERAHTQHEAYPPQAHSRAKDADLERRSSRHRHSHRTRTSGDEPRRSYTMPTNEPTRRPSTSTSERPPADPRVRAETLTSSRRTVPDAGATPQERARHHSSGSSGGAPMPGAYTTHRDGVQREGEGDQRSEREREREIGQARRDSKLTRSSRQERDYHERDRDRDAGSQHTKQGWRGW